MDSAGAASVLGCRGRYEFRRYCRPLKQVPGDLIDFLWLSDGKSLHEDVLRALSYASSGDDPSDDIPVATMRRR